MGLDGLYEIILCKVFEVIERFRGKYIGFEVRGFGFKILLFYLFVFLVKLFNFFDLYFFYL